MAEHTFELHTVAACGPGSGIARQFRVQVQDDSPQSWRLFEKFATHEEARHCADVLNQQGQTTRIIRYSLCPAA